MLLTPIKALIALVFIKTTEASWFISNISIHGRTNSSTLPWEPQSLRLHQWQKNISDRWKASQRRAGWNESDEWLFYMDGIVLHHKRSDCTGQNFWSAAWPLQLPVTTLMGMKTPSVSSFTITQCLCICQGSGDLLGFDGKGGKAILQFRDSWTHLC